MRSNATMQLLLLHVPITLVVATTIFVCSRGDCEAEEKYDPTKQHTIVVPEMGFAFFRIPPLDDIAAMEVELVNSAHGNANIAAFQVEKEFLGKIYPFFENCQIDQKPDVELQDASYVKLRLTTGEIMQVTVYGPPNDGPLSFSVFGIRIKPDDKQEKRIGSSNDFDVLVRRVYFRQTGHITIKLPSDLVRDYGLDNTESHNKQNKRHRHEP